MFGVCVPRLSKCKSNTEYEQIKFIINIKASSFIGLQQFGDEDNYPCIMATLGSVGEYSPTTENWSSYIERVEEFLLANDIGVIPAGASAVQEAAADRKKVAVLITLIGPKAYSTLRDLCSPDSPKDKTYTAVTKLLKSYYQPVTVEVAETFKFNKCIQEEKESVLEFSVRLRRLASSCDFGADLPRRLRDQLISGVRSAETRRKLLQKNMKFDEALRLALADESAYRESNQLVVSTPTGDVHHVRRHHSSSSYTHSKQKSASVHSRPSIPRSSNTKYKCYCSPVSV